MPILSYTPGGLTLLRYTTATGLCDVCVDRPTELLCVAYPEQAEPRPIPHPFKNTQDTLLACFSTIPLNPEANWQPPIDALPSFKRAFETYLAMIRLPIEQRWSVRGEPNHFLMGGYRHTDDSGWELFALTIATGKPAVLCFRCEDCIRALPLPQPFKTMTAQFSSDSTPEETVNDLPWDTSIRLDITNNGGASISLSNIK